MDTLNIAYMTCRKNCRFDWFADSLLNQLSKDFVNARIIVVDYWSQRIEHADWNDEAAVTRRDWFRQQVNRHKLKPFAETGIIVTPPKPCVWQGPHRLTKNDYFAPSNARNTALCYAADGWIAYVDDLSVLDDGWLDAVREAMEKNYIACGAFRKVKNIQVENGKVISFDPHLVKRDDGSSQDAGLDHRYNEGNGNRAVPCPPNWLFGCSVVMPVPSLLKINGWPEAVCDASGTGAEDCMTGLAFGKTGHQLKYDRRMFSYESEELHHQEPKMTRAERGEVGKPNSMSHAVVRMLQNADRFDNDFSPFPDCAALRQHILAGGEFPVPKNPMHCWYDGTPLSDL